MIKEQQNLEDKIENIRLEGMSKSEIEKTIAGFSTEAMEIRRVRKKIRYNLYRCRTEAEGKNAANVEEGFRDKFEKQAGFGGWRFFAVTWDVAFLDPEKVVSRAVSEQDEWNEIVAAKFPQLVVSENGTKVVYPDINVRKAVEREAIERGLLPDENGEIKKKVAKKKVTKKKVAKKTTGK